MAKDWGHRGPDGVGDVKPRESEGSHWWSLRLKLFSVPGWPRGECFWAGTGEARTRHPGWPWILAAGWVGVGGCRKGILIPSVSTPNRGAVGSLSNRGAVESPSNRGAVGSPPNRGREPAPGPLLSWRSPLCTRTSVPAPWSLVAVVSDSLRSHGL